MIKTQKRRSPPNPTTVRARILARGEPSRLQIDGKRIPTGKVVEVRTENCRYELTRIDETEWVIVGSARFRKPTVCFPHDGVIEQGKALMIGTRKGDEFPTAVVIDFRLLPKSARRARELIEEALFPCP